jgi:diguanylate cyclase (GGDEF)-like protein
MLFEKIFEKVNSRDPIFLDVGTKIREELRELTFTLARGEQVFFYDYNQEEAFPYAPFLQLVRPFAQSIQPYPPHRLLWKGWATGGIINEQNEFLLDEVDYENSRIRKTLIELFKAWDSTNHGTWIVLQALHMAPPSVWSLLPSLLELDLKCRFVFTWDSRVLFTLDHFENYIASHLEEIKKRAPVYQAYSPSYEVEDVQAKITKQSFWAARSFLAFGDGILFAEQILEQTNFDSTDEEILFRRAYADCLTCSGQSEDAIIQYQLAQKLSRDSNAQDLLVSIHRRLSALALKKGDSQEADRQAQQAFEISQKKLSDKEKVLSLFYVLFSRDNLTNFIQIAEDDSIIILENLINGLKISNLQIHLAALLTNGIIALIYYWKSNPERALQRVQEGIAIAREMGNQHRLAIGYHTLGILYQNQERSSEALEAYQSSLKYRKQMNLTLGYSQGLNGLGYFYYSLGDYNSALKTLKESLEIIQKTDNYPEIAATLYNLGTLYFYARHWEQSIYFLNSALTIMDNLDIENLPYNHRIDILAVLGLAYLKAGKDSFALEKEFQARRIYHLLNTKFRYEHFELLLALRESVEGRLDQAKERFETLISELDKKIENFRYVKLLSCAEAFSALGDSKYLDEGLKTLKKIQDNSYFKEIFENLRDKKELNPYPLATPPKLELERIIERGKKDVKIMQLHKKLEEAHFFYSYFDGLLHAKTKDDVVDVAYKILFQTYPAESLRVWLAEDQEQIPAEWLCVYRPWNQQPTPEHLRWLFEGAPPGWIHVSSKEEDIPAHALYGPVRRLDKVTERDIKLSLNQLILSLKLKMAHEKLEKAATLDPVTGLYNKFELERRLLFEEKRIKRHFGRPTSMLSILKVDIDNFGPFVDNYGHEAGDRILRWFAMGIKEAIRESDFAGRLDNDEFLIILSETDSQNAPMVARRLLKKVENRSYVWEALQELKQSSIKLDKNLGCSIGIAQFNFEENINLSEALEKANWALKLAKERGGNQIVVADRE